MARRCSSSRYVQQPLEFGPMRARFAVLPFSLGIVRRGDLAEARPRARCPRGRPDRAALSTAGTRVRLTAGAGQRSSPGPRGGGLRSSRSRFGTIAVTGADSGIASASFSSAQQVGGFGGPSDARCKPHEQPGARALSPAHSRSHLGRQSVLLRLRTHRSCGTAGGGLDDLGGDAEIAPDPGPTIGVHARRDPAQSAGCAHGVPTARGSRSSGIRSDSGGDVVIARVE
jgi:hypothetical protein